ncbi:hypothetical protein COP1_030328 [Malus domestica]
MAFSHQSTILRRQRNRILKLKIENDVWLEDKGLIRSNIDDYFRSLFSASQPRDFWVALSGLKSEQINEDLLKLFALEDIKCAVLQVGGLKVAEPDGFHGNFYHSCSEIVNKIISRAISKFSSLMYLHPDMNHINIILIPKIEVPESISHFRPISLCNFVYKIFLKLMASRLKTHLPGFISHHQSVFVPGH